MSQSKLCCFKTLATIVVLLAVKTSPVHRTDFDFGMHSEPHNKEFALHEPLSHVSESANQLVGTHLILGTKSETSQAIFLPVQSKNLEDLGLGKVLVASRNLPDPIFAKTVILLVHYDDKGVLGLMLNRRTDLPVSRVFKQLKAAKNRSDRVYAGGPVEIPAVFALLRSKAKHEPAERVLGDIYLISTQSLFEKTLSARPAPGVFHVYLGYAGWTPEQLRKEVEVGAWFIFQGDAQTVFDSNPDSLWSEMIRKTELKMASSRPADAALIQPVFGSVLSLALHDRKWIASY
jgi:putative transcriptional regulator